MTTTASDPQTPAESQTTTESIVNAESTELEGITADESADSATEVVPAVGNRRSRAVRIAAMVLAVAVPTSAAAFFYTRSDDDRTAINAQSSARTAACDYAKTMTNYDSKSIDKYVTSVLDGATGDFKTEFAKTSNELKDVISGAQIKSESRDARCGVATGDENHADVVVALSISISSVGTRGKQVPSQIALVASMDKIDGHWLVSKLDAPALQAPAAADAQPSSSHDPAPTGQPPATPR
ncbi:hypothetical protein [Nocardia tengchongensis]